MSKTVLYIFLGGFGLLIAYFLLSASSASNQNPIQNTSPAGPGGGVSAATTALSLAPSALSAISASLGQTSFDDSDDDGCC